MADVKPNHTLYINNLNEKVKKDELRKALYAIFSQFGQVIDIMCFKTLRMRGQAHVIFKDVNCASTAMRSMQGFPFYEKPMRIQFAKEDSDVISKAKGTYVERPRKTVVHNRTKDAAAPSAKKTKAEAKNAGDTEKGGSKSVAPPNKILFLSNLPEDVTEEMIRLVFCQFPGLVEIRMIPDRTDIAFVEFVNESEATAAKKALNHFKITPNQAMRVEYANK
uniref:U2 small nuclear ribonucleoprotein B n=1 Tax=Panagrellus redivivus TaxID=6233 RepID=A0A7E4ZYN5_PANRE